MALTEFTIGATCVADDATLYAHIASALARELPVVPQYLPHPGTAVVVGSGPSVSGYVADIFRAQEAGAYVVALKDAHDWLIKCGITPNAAVAIDPQASRAHVFGRPNASVHYLIASQVHPSMFEALAGQQVSLWHAYVRHNQTVPPPGTPLISGGTTTGLRAITLLYTMGFRDVVLYGFDSCLQEGLLRMNGDRPTQETIYPITCGGKTFQCTPAMTAQAREFQNLFLSMPDLTIRSVGDGLITAILDTRAAVPPRTVSFIHGGDLSVASYRYRADSPSRELGVSINAFEADVLIFSKPDPSLLRIVKEALGMGKTVIADFCDDHFDTACYRDFVRLADAVTCSTAALATIIATYGREATVIDDPYEFDERPPHCTGNRLLYFGHPTNGEGLQRIAHLAGRYPLTIVTLKDCAAIPGATVLEWSLATMRESLAWADIVIIPATAAHKSANRAVEAIRQGCFVVAEPHPSLASLPGIWIGEIEEGIQWASSHCETANQQTRACQISLSPRFDPKTVASAWSRVIQGCPYTWGADAALGRAGLTSMAEAVLKSSPT